MQTAGSCSILEAENHAHNQFAWYASRPVSSTCAEASMPTVKCRDCGRLAVRDRHKQGAIEASDLVRDEGWQIDSRGKQVIASTFCAARKRDLKATQSGLSAEVVAEINQEIECGGFRQWERGKSPEKHEEMTLLETLELPHAAMAI